MPIAPTLNAVLQGLCDQHSCGNPSEAGPEYVFVTTRGLPLDEGNVGRAWRRLLRVATTRGVRRLRLHDLRHSFASHALEAGKSIRWVSEVLGHANPELTLRVYAHVLRDEEEDLSFLDFEGAAERRQQTATNGNKRGGPNRGGSAKRLVPKRKHGAGNGTRTRDPQLGKLMLYQLSYSRPLAESTADRPAKVDGCAQSSS